MESNQTLSLNLSHQAKAALADFQNRLLTLFPGEISQLILYGSYARGEATLDSDVDVLVVVKWREERLPDGTYVAPISDPRWQSIINAATDSLLAYGLEIAPIVVSEQRFRKGFPLANRAKDEGLILWPNQN
jgi:hypothetical protein